METNLILNVKCANQHLLNYINDLINKNEHISGLEISLYTETPKQTKSLDDKKTLDDNITKSSIKNNNPNIPNINDNKYEYDGGWVDMEDKQAVQKMFDSFRI